MKNLLMLSAINLAFWSLDMACAIAGFHFGFGLEVKNWWALIGFMILSRWVVYVVRGCYELHQQRNPS